MDSAEVIIIGAGASGLTAARLLAEAGRKVIVIEARNRIGGRIHTLHVQPFNIPLEAGAEFIHGYLPYTLALLNESASKKLPMGGKMININNESNSGWNTNGKNYQLLENYLNKLTEDITVDIFLNRYFPGENNTGFRKSILGFVEGYDAADPARASTLTFRDEWLSDEESQYRIEGGYGQLTEYLAGAIDKAGGNIFLSSPVKNIIWEKGKVETVCSDGRRYFAGKVIVTVPAGIMTSNAAVPGNFSFTPPVADQVKAFESLGFGAVIKLLFLFSDPFWKEENAGKNTGMAMAQAGFLFSGATIPTWWTQMPDQSALLCGWLAGPRALQYKETSEETLKELGIESLARIFGTTELFIKQKLLVAVVFNWTADPYTQGGYAYATTDSEKHIKFLQKPVADTIFFAGEALYTGKATGTVEAAIDSGHHVASLILAHPFKQ